MTNSSKAAKEVPDVDEKFEFAEQIDNTAQMHIFWHDYPNWRKLVDDVRTFYAQNPYPYYIPNYA